MGDSEELPHRLEGIVQLVDRGDALDLLRLGHVRVQLARALPEGPPQRRLVEAFCAADAAGRGKRGTGGSGWVPATFSRAPSAAAGKTEPRDAAPARTSLPANVFARAAPAKKSAEISRLAGLFKRVEEKKHARAADSPPAPEAPEAAVPEPPAAPAAAAPPAASVPRGPMDAFAKLKAVYYADANKKRRRA